MDWYLDSFLLLESFKFTDSVILLEVTPAVGGNEWVYVVYFESAIHLFCNKQTIRPFTLVNIWSGSKVFLKPKCILVLGQLGGLFVSTYYIKMKKYIKNVKG